MRVLQFEPLARSDLRLAVRNVDLHLIGPSSRRVPYDESSAHNQFTISQDYRLPAPRLAVEPQFGGPGHSRDVDAPERLADKRLSSGNSRLPEGSVEGFRIG